MLNAAAAASHAMVATEASEVSAVKSRPKPGGASPSAGKATEGLHSRVPPRTLREGGGR